MVRTSRRKTTQRHDQKQEDAAVAIAVDRLSELPESLIANILSCLDMKDSVRTSVLSKSWKYYWTQVDSIVFHFDSLDGIDFYCDMLPSTQQLEKYMLFVDHTLMQCTSPKIKKFTLTGWFNYLEGGEAYICTREFSFSLDKLVDKWIDFVLGKKVEVLKLGLRGFDYLIPDCVYRSSSLTRLEIDEVGKQYGRCMADFTSLARMSEPGPYGHYVYNNRFDICCNKLKLLFLKSVHVTEEFMNEILLGCHVLETLVLDEIGGLLRLNITSPSVTELRLLNFFFHHEDGNAHININAPWVKKLEISGAFYCFSSELVCVTSLKSANLTLSYGQIDHMDGPGCDFILLSSHMIDTLLEPVCNVDDLVIGAELLQAVSVSHLNEETSLLLKLKYLTIQSHICIHDVPGIVCLLESSPNLETLVMRVMPWQCDLSRYDNYHYGNYIKEAFTSFDAVGYLWEQEENYPSLKNVKIDCREKLGACDANKSTHDDESFELEIAAYIIKHAPFLEKLVILSSKSNCSKCGAGYFSILSWKDKVGKKAWELKETDSTYEFIFSPLTFPA